MNNVFSILGVQVFFKIGPIISTLAKPIDKSDLGGKHSGGLPGVVTELSHPDPGVTRFCASKPSKPPDLQKLEKA